jgi:quinol monooxygenase YgiN
MSMIIVSAKVTASAGKRDAFIQAAQPCIAATRKETGCILYELYASTEDADKLMYFEKWTNRDVLDKHMQSEHMKAFARVKEERGLQTGDLDVGIYDVAE